MSEIQDLVKKLQFLIPAPQSRYPLEQFMAKVNVINTDGTVTVQLPEGITLNCFYLNSYSPRVNDNVIGFKWGPVYLVLASLGNQSTVYVFAQSGKSQTWTLDTEITVLFNTEVEDTHNAYNLATGVFTAPIAGLYLATASMSFNRPDFINALPRVRWVWPGENHTWLQMRPDQVTSSEAARFSGSITARLAKGDTFQLRCAMGGLTITSKPIGGTFTIAWTGP